MTIKLFRQNIKTMSNEELEQETNRLSEYIHKHHSRMGARNTTKLGHCWLEAKRREMIITTNNRFEFRVV